MPRPEAGPVSGRLMPIVMSAWAACAASAIAVAARALLVFMLVSGSAAQRLDVVGHGDRTQALRVVCIAPREGAHLAAFADQLLAARHAVHLHEHLAAPFFDVRGDADRLAVSDGLDESGVDLEQR